MYSSQKYLFYPANHCQKAINSWISGGFPHSEICGSKGALPSPQLIAECHVLHRLLSPRHSPNALIALDPIQKTKDQWSQTCLPSGQTSAPPRPYGQSGASLRPSGTTVVPTDLHFWIRFILIRCWISPAPRSVHRLGKTAFACPPRSRYTRGEPPDHTNTGARRPPLTRERRTKASRVSLSSRCQRP